MSKTLINKRGRPTVTKGLLNFETLYPLYTTLTRMSLNRWDRQQCGKLSYGIDKRLQDFAQNGHTFERLDDIYIFYRI